MTVLEFAEHRGVSRQSVYYALASGRFKKGPDGKLDVIECDKAWDSQTDATKPKGRPKGRPPKLETPALTPEESRQLPVAAPPVLPTEPPKGSDLPIEGATYMDNRAVREFHLARIAKIEADEAEGAVVDVENVKAAWSKVIGEAKTRFLAVGSKAKGRIPHLSVDEIEVINDLVREALGEVAECPLPSKG